MAENMQFGCSIVAAGRQMQMKYESVMALTDPVCPWQPRSLIKGLHDWLGWNSFLEDGFSAPWVEHRAHHINGANFTCLANFWARGLILRLLQMTHAQLIYRNSTIHAATKEGRTAAAHETILRTMKEFLHTTQNSFWRSIVISSPQTLLRLHLAPLKINRSGMLKSTLLLE